MAKKDMREKRVTVPQVKHLLESIGEEKLDQFQRRTLDYTAKFSKVDAATAETLLKRLTEEFELLERIVCQRVWRNFELF